MNLTRSDYITVFIGGLLTFVILSSAAFAEQPSTWFCVKARMHRAQFSTDKAAEAAARSQGADDATIAKAKLCRR